MAIDPALLLDAAAATVVPAALVAILLRQPWRLARPLAVGLAFATAFAISRGWPGVPWNADVLSSLAWIALATALLVAALAARSTSTPLFAASRRPALAAACFLAVWYLLDFMREHHWSPREAWLWSVGLASGLFVVARAKAALLERPRLEAAAVRGFECVLAGGLLHQGRSDALALLAVTLGVCQATATLAAPKPAPKPAPKQTRGPAPGPSPVGASAQAFASDRTQEASGLTAGLLYGGILLAGRYSAELTWPAALSLAALPFVPRVLERTPLGRHRVGRPLATLATLALQALLVGLVAWWIWQSTPPDPYAAYR